MPLHLVVSLAFGCLSFSLYYFQPTGLPCGIGFWIRIFLLYFSLSISEAVVWFLCIFAVQLKSCCLLWILFLLEVFAYALGGHYWIFYVSVHCLSRIVAHFVLGLMNCLLLDAAYTLYKIGKIIKKEDAHGPNEEAIVNV